MEKHRGRTVDATKNLPPDDPALDLTPRAIRERLEDLEHRVKVLEGIQAGSGLMVQKIVSENK
jgi:hypothetical protein